MTTFIARRSISSTAEQWSTAKRDTASADTDVGTLSVDTFSEFPPRHAPHAPYTARAASTALHYPRSWRSLSLGAGHPGDFFLIPSAAHSTARVAKRVDAKKADGHTELNFYLAIDRAMTLHADSARSPRSSMIFRDASRAALEILQGAFPRFDGIIDLRPGDAPLVTIPAAMRTLPLPRIIDAKSERFMALENIQAGFVPGTFAGADFKMGQYTASATEQKTVGRRNWFQRARKGLLHFTLDTVKSASRSMGFRTEGLDGAARPAGDRRTIKMAVRKAERATEDHGVQLLLGAVPAEHRPRIAAQIATQLANIRAAIGLLGNPVMIGSSIYIAVGQRLGSAPPTYFARCKAIDFGHSFTAENFPCADTREDRTDDWAAKYNASYNVGMENLERLFAAVAARTDGRDDDVAR